VDQPHYERLRAAMEQSAAGRVEFHRAVEVVGGEGDAERHATLRMRADGQCPFLQDDHLCSVQHRYGEAFLGNMCATYPRDISRIGGRIEVTATLSCPEVARQCLLADDATELEDLDPRLVPRAHVLRSLHGQGDDPYLARFDDIRTRVVQLLSLHRYPLSTRLFFVTYLAQRVTPFFSRGATNIDDNRLDTELGRFDDSAFRDELHRQFSAIEIPGEQAFKITEVIVLARLQVHIPYFRQLVADVVSANGRPAATGDASGETLWPAYRERRAYWTVAYGGVLDRWLGNYCKNYWLRDWYVLSPNLLVHTQNLLIRLAILRFLLFSDSRLQDAAMPAAGVAHAAVDARARLATLQTTAVDVIHKVVRAIEHDPSFLQRVQDTLEAEGLQTFAHLVFLLKF
jgi:lysine-N-methylase